MRKEALDLFPMKIQIDLKSILCGLIIGVAAMFAVGAGTSSNEIGRYQVAVNTGAVALVIDTATGKVWNVNQTSATLRATDGNFYDAKNQ